MHGYPQIIFITHNLLYSNASTMYNTNQAVKAARRGQGWVDMGYNENVTSPPSEIWLSSVDQCFTKAKHSECTNAPIIP